MHQLEHELAEHPQFSRLIGDLESRIAELEAKVQSEERDGSQRVLKIADLF